MLQTVETSTAKKTRGCAVTYRAGAGEKFGTCPSNCELNPSSCGSSQIDFDYLGALLQAKPKHGHSFTYTHFSPLHWEWRLNDKSTVLNYSTSGAGQAISANKHFGVPVVCTVSPNFWREGAAYEAELVGEKNRLIGGELFVRCPEEYGAVGGCADCGGKDGPLCARLNRGYIIGFTAHGRSKAAASDPQTRGGCYAAGGNVNLHWSKLADKEQVEPDGEKLVSFVQSLPARAIVRHHVAGDIGLDSGRL